MDFSMGRREIRADVESLFFVEEYIKNKNTTKLTLLTVALISTGRMLYFGKRRDMLPYFAYIDFPCPAYKNPSDYYLDLVTLDNLSSEAMLESSQRVENLVDIFRRRQEALSDPGPPGQPSSGFKTANFFTQILALWIRVLIYMFPFNIIGFVGDAILAAMMSVLVGAVYWNVRLGREQEHVNDRFGFYYALMSVAVWPFLLRIVAKVWREKKIVYKDIREGLYGKAAYLFSKAVYSLPVSAALIVAYVVPAYSMAGLEGSTQVRSYGIYIGYMLLYMFCLRAVASTSAWLCSTRHLAAVLAGFVLTFVFLSSGYAVHLKDLSLVLFWTQWVSPARWISEQLLTYEFHERYEYVFEGEGKYYCSHNPVVQQDTAILVRAECGIKQDPDALRYFGYRDDWSTWQPLVITFAFLIATLAVGWATFIFSTPNSRKKRPVRGRFAKV